MELHPSSRDAGADAGPLALASSNAYFSRCLIDCRESLLAFPVDGPLKPLRGPIRALAVAAFKAGIPPERLIAELKKIVFELPQFTTRRAVERGDMMHQLVSVAINAYYAREDDS